MVHVFFKHRNFSPPHKSPPSFLAKVLQFEKRDSDEMEVLASQEETNFSQAKEAVEAVQLRHPLVYDQYALCAMAIDDKLRLLKLPLLQRVCEDLGLDIPLPPVRKKAPYLALQEDITSKCTCRK